MVNKKLLAGLFVAMLVFHEKIFAFASQHVKYNVDMFNPNLIAFLKTIRQCEGTLNERGYNTIVGYSYFNSFDAHPKVYKELTINGRKVRSSAAGAYQFIFPTWERVRKKLNLPDFSPYSQDRAAVELISERGALQDVYNGDIEEALKKCSKEWASLPYSTANQNPKTLAQTKEFYIGNGGKLA